MLFLTFSVVVGGLYRDSKQFSTTFSVRVFSESCETFEKEREDSVGESRNNALLLQFVQG